MIPTLRRPLRFPFPLLRPSAAFATVLAAVSLSALPKAMAAPDSVVTFNELSYHPPDPLPPATASAPEWVELHNQMSVRVDLGGWTLRGGIDFTFPEGTVMEPGAFLVVSAIAGSPSGALGPFTGKLDNGGEEIRLHERWGRMMDRLNYDDSGAWPSLPDGQGPTLSKRNANFLSDTAASWSASTDAIGTPGAENFPASTDTVPRALFTAGGSWKYEPTGTDPGPLWANPAGFSDATWTTGAAPLATAAPATPPAPVTTLPAGRSAYFLRKSFAWSGSMPFPRLLLTGTLKGQVECYFNGTLVATRPGPLTTGLALAATDLVAGANLLAIKITPAPGSPDVAIDLAASLIDGTTNVSPALLPAAPGPVVVNEISYHARPTFANPATATVFADNPAEWLELHNPGATPVDLSGWRLGDAVDYAFPPGTQLAAGGFLVVNNNQFSGSLANSGDRIRLRDFTDTIIDEVPYFDDGRWPDAADGGGSTLELTDPAADRRSPESWAASDESTRSAWQTITYRALGAEPANSNNPSTWREFLLGFLDNGEALIDDVSVIEDPDTARVQVIQNGTFEADTIGGGAAKWRLLGTHKTSKVIANPDGTGKVLLLAATGATEHTYNNASTTLVGNRVINPAKTYEISFRAKWISGSPQLNSRLYLNRASRTTILTQPLLTGTPGAANSKRIPNAGPSCDGLRHSPLVPAASQPVRVSISLADPAGLRGATLFYSVNQGAWQQTPMGGDESGRFFGIFPGQATGAQVQFYVEATDSTGAVSQFPPGGAASRAICKFGDGGIAAQPVRNKMRLLMNAADAAELHNPIHGVSNFRWPCTVIYNDREVWYDARVRLRSAPFGRQGNRAGWNIQFGPEHPFRGVQTSIVIDGAFNMPKGDGTGWLENSLGPSVNEMVYQAIANRAGGIPATYDDVVYFQTPRTTEGNRRAQLKMTRFNPSYLEEAFDNGADGTLYKQELIYYPTATVDGNPESLKNGYSAVVDTEIKTFGGGKEGWRWNYLLQTNADRDDFSRLMALGTAFDSSAATLYANTSAVMDMENWTRVFALSALTGLADTYNNGLAHNIQLYARPSDGKMMLFPWDQDHTFYYATNSNIFGAGSHRLAAILNLAQNRRLYAGHLRHLCQTAFTNTTLDPIINHLSSATVADRALYAASLRTWVTNRRAFVLSQITTQFPNVSFAITTNAGADFNTTQTAATVAGNGWINVHEIRVSKNGAPAEAAPVTWTSGQAWQIILPVAVGANTVVLTAYDHDGVAVGTDSVTITNLGAVEPASAANLVITEINYNPAGTAAEEYIELQNIGTRTIDLTGVRFTEGIAFAFTGSSVTSLAPGQRVLVVEDRTAFSARYGTAISVAGAYGPLSALSNGGDTIALRDRADAIIARFAYNNQEPWPMEADGGGFTLTLIRPNLLPDPSLPGNWRTSRLPGGSAGIADDLNSSSFPTLTDYAFTALPSVSRNPAGQIILTWTERLGADSITITPETSDDLGQWTPAFPDAPALPSLTMQSTVLNQNGTRTLTATFPGLPARKYVRFHLAPRLP
ncbi:MAG: hypothetical protein JWL81_2263 [Verrucomicrobiales bacterium]|nr:hypothetical protein [Verrucomicrobiales bacterium]